MRSLLVALALLGAASSAPGEVFRTDHVTVHYAGITEPQAVSLARVAGAARKAALDRYGFDVPAAVTIDVDCKPANTVRLFTDGHDRFTLRLRTPADLAPPAQSGVRNLYGLCHELGHVVMYRVMRDHDYLTGDALEGWAHYIGSRLVDDVFAAESREAWWEPYDYSVDGMNRLEAQLRESSADGVTSAAGLWKELHEILGERGMAGLFAALGRTRVDTTDPAAAVKPLVLAMADDARLAHWWDKASPVLLKVTPRSPFAAAAAAAATTGPSTGPAAPAPAPPGKPAPAGAAKELAHDDGKSADKSSIAGSGHAVAFDAPEGAGWRVTAVKVFGSRYGAPEPPAEDFHVYLCDADGKQVAEVPLPYKTFLRGEARWVTLKLKEPIALPAGMEKFMIVLVFKPTATKGVYVHYDASADGDSRTGTPGNLNDAFGKGDWMIRAVLQPAKE